MSAKGDKKKKKTARDAAEIAGTGDAAKDAAATARNDDAALENAEIAGTRGAADVAEAAIAIGGAADVAEAEIAIGGAAVVTEAEIAIGGAAVVADPEAENRESAAAAEAETAARDAAAVLEKYDRESSFRNKLPKSINALIGVMLVAFSAFQLYSSVFTIQERQLRPIHLMFTLSLVYLLYPADKRLRRDRIPWYDWLCAAASAAVTIYIPLNLGYIVKNVGNYGPIQILVGAVAILLLMEACRRIVGMPILIIVSCFLAYTLFGQFIPGTFGHRGYSIRQLVTHMYFTLEGVFGTPIGVSAMFIFLFILFGAFLEQTGVGKFFIDLANAIAGKRLGGPAKVAVISSAFFGTVSGSSVANTVGTGSFTIPAMKKLGYKPEFAGAVEAAASTGGQIMPPVMGAAAFLMAENTGFTYGRIVMSAIIPAVLYFAGILISVHHEARKEGLRGMSPDRVPKARAIIRERGYLLIPLIYMIYMLSAKSTPAYAALGAILASIMSYSVNWFALLPIGFMVICKIFVPALHFTQYAAIALGIWIVICAARYIVNISSNRWREASGGAEGKPAGGAAQTTGDAMRATGASQKIAGGMEKTASGKKAAGGAQKTTGASQKIAGGADKTESGLSGLAGFSQRAEKLATEILGFRPMELLDGLRNGARGVLMVATACAMAGLIVGSVTLTGLGLKFATGLKFLSGGNIFLLMFFTMLSSLVLGMGVPTTANYLITSTICAPALITLLMDMNGMTAATSAIIMGAHLFVFYFGIIADITPPVALAAMAGSAIAKGEPFKTGVTATRIAIGAFIVPYIFLLNPAMLMIDTHFLVVIQSLASALLGMYALSGALAGYMQDRNRWYEGALLAVSGLAMIYPETYSDIIGLALLVFVFAMQKLRARRQAAAGAV